MSSHSASRRWYGCEFTSIVMMCLPSGASDGSCTVGKHTSMWAGSAAMPCTACACWKSMSATNGFISMMPVW